LLGFWALAIILYSEKDALFWKLDLFPSSGQGVNKRWCLNPRNVTIPNKNDLLIGLFFSD
jgi:hypothetical protein